MYVCVDCRHAYIVYVLSIPKSTYAAYMYTYLHLHMYTVHTYMYMYVCAQTIHAYTCTCIVYVLGIPKSTCTRM